MTYQEALWAGKYAKVVGTLSKSGKEHTYVAQYIGKTGYVIREAKNGMLLVHVGRNILSIPAGCLELA
jgi:membrane protein implicated in regulation of membrane protease activity